MHLVDHARGHIERTWERSPVERAIRTLLGAVLPRPGLARLALLAARGPALLAPLLGGAKAWCPAPPRRPAYVWAELGRAAAGHPGPGRAAQARSAAHRLRPMRAGAGDQRSGGARAHPPRLRGGGAAGCRLLWGALAPLGRRDARPRPSRAHCRPHSRAKPPKAGSMLSSPRRPAAAQCSRTMATCSRTTTHTQKLGRRWRRSPAMSARC